MKFLLVLVILASACAAPQSRPCITGKVKVKGSDSTGTVESEASPDFTEEISQDPTNHYYFSAPLDNTASNPKPSFRTVPDEVRYNIIFVKVPPFIPKVQEVIELPAKIEEKTSVYVLVKKPEDPNTITLPEEEKRPDEKPEVFVVKYNKDKDIQATVEGIQQSLIYGDIELAKSLQLTEEQVNDNLAQVKKEDITNLTLVGNTRESSGGEKKNQLGDNSDFEIEDEETAPTGTNRQKSETGENTNIPKHVDDYLNANQLKTVHSQKKQ